MLPLIIAGAAALVAGKYIYDEVTKEENNSSCNSYSSICSYIRYKEKKREMIEKDIENYMQKQKERFKQKYEVEIEFVDEDYLKMGEGLITKTKIGEESSLLFGNFIGNFKKPKKIQIKNIPKDLDNEIEKLENDVKELEELIRYLEGEKNGIFK